MVQRRSHPSFWSVTKWTFGTRRKCQNQAWVKWSSQPTELSSLLTRIVFHLQIKSVVDGCEMIKSYRLCSARSGDGLEDTFQEACRVALAGTKPKATKKKGCSILWVHLCHTKRETKTKKTKKNAMLNISRACYYLQVIKLNNRLIITQCC